MSCEKVLEVQNKSISDCKYKIILQSISQIFLIILNGIFLDREAQRKNAQIASKTHCMRIDAPYCIKYFMDCVDAKIF